MTEGKVVPVTRGMDIVPTSEQAALARTRFPNDVTGRIALGYGSAVIHNGGNIQGNHPAWRATPPREL